MAEANFTLTQDYLNAVLEYRDGFLFWKERVALCLREGSKAGTKHDKTGYMRIQIKRKQYMVHRVIFLMHHGYMPVMVDHIDGNNTNNKIENLRGVSASQNSMNSKIRVTNTSGFKNVYWNTHAKRWGVVLKINGKIKNLGYYGDIELADLVAQEARDKYFKQYARHR